MSEDPVTQLRQANWKRITAGAVLRGAALAATVVLVSLVMTAIGDALGWPAHMIRDSVNVGAGAILLVAFIHVARPVRSLFRDSDGERQAFTTEEIHARVQTVRRRHYQKQLLKVAGGVLMAALGGANAFLLTTHRADLFGTFEEIFGASAALNYNLMIGMMAFGSIIGAGTAVWAWWHRYGDGKEQVYRAVEELDDEGS